MAEVRFIGQSHEILAVHGGVRSIAAAARTCYRSEANAGPEADERLVRSLIANGHHAMLEHSYLSVRFLTDRAIANELVRHRLLSFAQESTRYVNYGSRGLDFIRPLCATESQGRLMVTTCRLAADAYEALVEDGTSPEAARAVLPLCTATRIVASGNFREWRHVMRLRTARDAHPQVRALMVPLLEELRETVPVIFDDLEVGDA